MKLGQRQEYLEYLLVTGDTNIDDDRYVAVMGGGMGNTFICSGSNVFIVDLESGAYNDGDINSSNRNK